MIRRLAVVLWWIGAILVALGVYGVLNHSETIVLIAFLFFPAVVCFSLAFVLGGSFLRPPRS